MDYTPIWFTYSSHKTRVKAEEALESYYAEGLTSPCENRIVCKMHKMPWHVQFKD